MNTNSYQSQPIRSFEILSAITMGNATVHDLAEQLKRHGLPFSYSKLRTKTPQEIVSRIVQRVPKVPFILNGTMYDPKDITRFNGYELHFVPAPSGDHMLVVDNPGLIKSWLRLLHYEKNGYTMRQTAQPGAHYGGHVYPSSQPGTPIVPSVPIPSPGGGEAGGELPGFGLFSVSTGDDRTFFYEHINSGGASFVLHKGRAYRDLTRVYMFPFGNWNDEISSLSGSNIVTLYEHINFGGQTLILNGPINSLVEYGWNDRTSSVKAL